MWARDLILFYLEFYKSQNFRGYRRFNAHFFCLFNQLPLHFVSRTSPVCVRRYFCFTRTYVSFHTNENCVNNTATDFFHSSQNFNFTFIFPLDIKYLAWRQKKNSKWVLARGMPALGFYARRPATYNTHINIVLLVGWYYVRDSK